tara:strand:+ start:1091 stop:2113 length:1023 start_codon:yes stop_codon:yes gene_type:complete
MALTKISTDSIKDDAITKAKIPADQIEASELANNAVDTNAIADQAVTLDKLPHGDTNNDGKFLRANNGADPSYETVNIPAGTNINNNANNRVITGSNTADTLEAEANLSYTGDKLTVKSGAHDGGLELLAANNNQTTRIKIQGKHSGGSERNWFIEVPRGSDILNFFDDSHGSHTQLIDNGDLSIVDGNLLFAANHGFTFSNNTTSSASGVSNQDNDEIFNYYEFGDWTPTTNAGGMSMASSGGHYFRMGALVWVGCNMTFGSQSGGGTISVGGLPFSIGSGVFGGGSVKYSNISPSSYDGIIMIHLDASNPTAHFPNISISEASGKRLDWSAVYTVYNF